MDIGAIQQAGLTLTEAKIYSVLLKQKGQQAGEIAKQTGIHRRNVYDAIERLVSKGLVGEFLEGKKKHFVAESPKRLLGLIKERETSLNRILPSLQAIYDTKKQQAEVQIYKGRAGLRSVLEDQLYVKNESIWVYGAYNDFSKALKYYFPHFEKNRIMRKVKVRLLLDTVSRDKPKKGQFLEIRYLPNFWSGPVSVNIYRNNVAIILWEEQPITILISSKQISDSYRSYFNLLWKIAEK